MKQSKLAWDLLVQSTGAYSGRGVNHEGQPFTSELRLSSAVPGKALSVALRATGDSKEIYHDEHSLLGFDVTGALTLFVASSNHPALVPHHFDRIEEKEDAKNIVFRFGHPDDRMNFREEITLSFHRDGSVSHHYAWGMPGGDFAPRSGSRMQKQAH